MDANLPPDYRPTLPPFAHQAEALALSYRKRFFALLMEQGTGKTKVVIDTCVLHYRRKTTNALLVLAPNDVHDQWVLEQFPLHWPKDIPLRAEVWDARRAASVRACQLLATRPLPERFTVLAMNHDALATKRGRECAKAFLKHYRCMFVLDESHGFKTPKALRTRAVQQLAALAPVRRILTGTPKTQSPFDLWSQFRFLNPDILGFDSFLTFKHHYGIWNKEHKLLPPDPKGRRKLLEYETLQEYARLEELYGKITPYSYRARKSECLDLPPKLYSTRLTHLSDEQAAVYAKMRDEGLVLLARAEAGEPVTIQAVEELDEEELIDALKGSHHKVSTQIKLTLYLRLHQILGGFLMDDQRRTHVIDGKPEACPRIQATLDLTQQALDGGEAKVIIWAAFRAEIAALSSLIPGAVRIDGSVTGNARREAIEAFKDPGGLCRTLVAHPRTMGTGQNLTVARTSIYYSNPWAWVLRAQSEDRTHRIGQQGTVSVIDLKAKGGPYLDTRILEALAKHGDLAEQFMSYNATQLKELL